jgi:hypothetical protein
MDEPKRSLYVMTNGEQDVTVPLGPSLSAADWLELVQKRGGFWHDNSKYFIPWHSITWITLRMGE